MRKQPKYQSEFTHEILVDACKNALEKLDERQKNQISNLAVMLTDKMRERKAYFSEDQALVVLAAIGLVVSHKRFSEVNNG